MTAHNLFGWNYAPVLAAAKDGLIHDVVKQDDVELYISVGQLQRQGLLKAEISATINTIAHQILSMGQEAIKRTKNQERDESLLDLLKRSE